MYNNILLLFPGACGHEYFWIGLRDSSSEGQFKWTATGENVEYSAWAVCEPNDANNGEDCAEMRQFYGFLWNDARCSKNDNNQFAICEYYRDS